MTLADCNPLGRFTGLADLYARYRPSYPQAALEKIRITAGLSSASLLVDVGCGTGIAARLFAALGIRVIGIEPNADMRQQAEQVQVSAPFPPPSYQAGTAEATGLADNCADAVLAAQAFHWFQPQPALQEFYRILKPGGWVALLWNERDERDPFTAAYGAVFRTVAETHYLEGTRATAGTALLHSPLFPDADTFTFAHEQTLEEESLLGRAFSASYAPREPAQAAEFTAALREVFQRFAHAGQVTLKYATTLYLGQRGE